MKRALVTLLLLAGCGAPSESGPSVPLAITIERAAGAGTPVKLQLVLAGPAYEVDTVHNSNRCTRAWLDSSKALMLSDGSGGTHPAQVITLQSGQTSAEITGIPPTNKAVALIVEGFDADNHLVAWGAKNPIDAIGSGKNPPVALTMATFAAVDCGTYPFY